jgi:hypothetical protein
LCGTFRDRAERRNIEARAFLERAMVIKERAYAADHPEVAEI